MKRIEQKEIYDGDILHCKEYKNIGYYDFPTEKFAEIFTLDELKGEKRADYISQVFYDEANFYLEETDYQIQIPLCCFFGDMKVSQPIFEAEIIGNIFNNPELLNQNASN